MYFISACREFCTHHGVRCLWPSVRADFDLQRQRSNRGGRRGALQTKLGMLADAPLPISSGEYCRDRRCRDVSACVCATQRSAPECTYDPMQGPRLCPYLATQKYCRRQRLASHRRKCVYRFCLGLRLVLVMWHCSPPAVAIEMGCVLPGCLVPARVVPPYRMSRRSAGRFMPPIDGSEVLLWARPAQAPGQVAVGGIIGPPCLGPIGHHVACEFAGYPNRSLPQRCCSEDLASGVVAGVDDCQRFDSSPQAGGRRDHRCRLEANTPFRHAVNSPSVVRVGAGIVD